MLHFIENNLTYTVFFPQPLLQDHIEYFFEIKGYPSFSFERLIPNGMPEMVINLGDSCQGHAPYLTDAIVLKKACVSGIKTQHFNCNHSGLFHLLGIRFKPTGLCKFFDMEGTDIKSHIYTIEDLIGNRFDSTYEKIYTAESIWVRIKTLESWLLKRLKEKEVWEHKIDDAIMRIKNFSHKLEDIIGDCQCSHKQFIHQFKRTTGILPSQLEQIVRFQQLVRGIQNSIRPDWQEIAYTSGYYDQSHLIHSFKKFTGITPSEYQKVAHLSQENIVFFD